MRHCIVLPLTLTLLIGAQALQGIEQIAQQSQHGLALATQIIFQLRRAIHEKGGLNQVPPAHPEPNSPPIIRAICEQIAGAVVASLATETILHHQITFQPLPAPGCTRLLQSAVTPLHLAGQLHPSLAITALRELPPGATVLITDQHDTRYSLLHQHSKAPHATPNVKYECYPCRCGSVHIPPKPHAVCSKEKCSCTTTKVTKPPAHSLCSSMAHTNHAPKEEELEPLPSSLTNSK